MQQTSHCTGVMHTAMIQNSLEAGCCQNSVEYWKMYKHVRKSGCVRCTYVYVNSCLCTWHGQEFTYIYNIWTLARLRYRSHGLRYRSMNSYVRISLYQSPKTSILKHFILTSIWGPMVNAGETRRRRKADRAWWDMKCGCGAVQTCLYCVHTYINIHAKVCTMHIQIDKIMNMYVHAIYH